ncbi:MAG: hypothetical protein ACYS5W_14060, partial [Planctomycetota bacterium]
MRPPHLFVVVPLLATLASLPAQEEESRFLKAQAKRLNSYAKFALAQGFPRPAKLAFMEVIADYDKDDAVARKALGYLPIGQTWGPDPRFEFPSNDSPSPQAAIKVKSRWKSTARAIGAAHRSRATMFAEAGRVDRAEYHYRRTLRFLPDDKVAMEGLKFKQFGGLSGTSLEQGLYERTKLMQKLIKRELKKKYPVTKLPADERHPVLEKSSIKYEGYKSEHFVIWG